MNNLQHKHCKPCEDKSTPSLTSSQSEALSKEVDNWTIEDDKKLEKTLVFKNFKEALAFINKVGVIAEAENHHPDLSLFDYKKVRIELSTHSIDGLTENDFILAAKIDELKRNEIKD